MQSASTQTPTSLRNWIINQYQAFNRDYLTGKLKDWIVCVGNEAGDLDTIASSIAFAYCSSVSNPSAVCDSTPKRYIPIQQTKSTELKLRPENLRVLKLIDLLNDTQSVPIPELIYSDRFDFNKLTPYSAKYALLDHNRINQVLFGDSAQVVAVIDHHQAEAGNTLYPSANPRLIQVPTGSCASLVTTYFSSTLSSFAIPQSLADLLLSAIAIDTHNFKTIAQEGKSTETDISAKQWLWPRSQFSQTSASSLSPVLDFPTFYKQIHQLKGDVSSLNSDELLKRDYKHYMINRWSLGISSVPTSLEYWVGKKYDGDWPKLLDDLKQYANSKQLDAASILTDPPKIKKSNCDTKQPQSQLGRRLVLLVIDHRLSHISNSIVQEDSSIKSDDTLAFLSEIIQDPASIDAWSIRNDASVRVLLTESSVTRKQVAPVLTNLIEKLGPKI